MNSLGSRLLAAFLLIILLVILLVGLTLIVLLRNNPIVERQSFIRLNDVARAITRQGLLQPGLPSADFQARIEQIADSFDVRVLVARREGQVVLDSGAGQAPALDFASFRAARRDATAREALAGRARDDVGRWWLYITRPAGSEHVLVLAEQQPRAPAFAFFREHLLLPLLEAAGVATLVAVILAVLISRSIAGPLQRMAAVAGGIARGDYTQAAPVSGPDEVRALGQAFNSMARQVQATQQAQRDFLANVSHELKTPLTSIQGFAQALLDGAADSPQALKHFAGIIHHESDRMRRLVVELLDLARLQVDLHSLRRVPVDVRAVLGEVAEGFGLRAAEQGVGLKGELPPSLPAVLGDADRLAQIFTNLLDNAFKHTPRGGQVKLSALAVPGAIEVTVQDSGSGIPPEDLGRIFERFYQVDKSRAHSGGVGLGLAITREIVDAHGGSVRAASTPGQGTSFVVRLPAARSDAVSAARKK